jgi:hypothetical protein
MVLILTGLAALMSACGDGGLNKDKPVVKVNDYVIGEEDFQRALARSAQFHDVVGLSLEDRRRILDEQIRKELLIQAAIKQGLDKDPEFRQTIERYWEQTLIAFLLKRQCVEAGKCVVVTEEEIDRRCRELAAKSGADPASLSALREQVGQEILEERKTALLEEWTQELRKKAKIEIYKENL